MTKNKTCLIIEEDHDIARLTEKTIQLADLETITCSTSQDALKLLDKEYYNIKCILLNMTLSSRGTFDFLEEVAKKEEYQRIPIFMMSGNFYNKAYPNEKSPKEVFFFLNNLYSIQDLMDFLNIQFE